jgi:hypothetical protein
LVFFLILWLLDFPKPGTDDLFVAGAALNMAEGGDYSNPLIARQEFPSHFFFVHPPLHSYVYAVWLRVFGVNSASVTAYPIVNYLIIAVATIAILRRHGASRWFEWCVPLGVSFVMLPLGLRQEPLALSLSMTGFALADADSGRRRGWVQFIAFLLMFLGGSAAPRVVFFIAALPACAAYLAWRNAAGARERWGLVGWWVGALLVTVLVFLVLIDFRLGEFVHTFRFHAAGRVYKSKFKLIHDYLLLSLGYIQLSILVLPLALLLYALTKPKDDLSILAMFIAGAVPLSLIAGAIGSGTAWWAILVMLLLGASLVKGLPRSRGIALQVVIAVTLLVVNRKVFAECWGLCTGKIDSERGGQLAAALRLKPTPEHPLLVDSWVARYVWDYRLPDGTLDLEWGTRFPGASPGAYRVAANEGTEVRPGDIYVIGYYLRNCLEQRTYLEPLARPQWAVLGLKKLAFERSPREVYVIPAESCRTVRLDARPPLPGE